MQKILPQVQTRYSEDTIFIITPILNVKTVSLFLNQDVHEAKSEPRRSSTMSTVRSGAAQRIQRSERLIEKWNKTISQDTYTMI